MALAGVLVIGAHPDDADFHAGGTAALWVQHQIPVTFVSMTDGAAGHQTLSGGPLAQRRRAEAEAAGKLLGIDYLILDYPDGGLEPTREARRAILRLIRERAPRLVLTHRPNDYHPDHRYTAQIVQDAAYLVAVPALEPAVPALSQNPIFGYTSDSFTRPYPFAPDVVVAVDSVREMIADLLHCHESQVYEWLPWIGGFADQVPADALERRKIVWELYGRGHAAIAERFRDHLARAYGPEQAARVRFAEAFEISEYGAPLTDAARRELFPFLPR